MIGLFTAALVVATWPLWWGGTAYPMIPWFGVLRAVPLAADRGLTIGLLLATLALVAPIGRLRSWGLLLGSLSGLLLLDQHRFQPWAWLMWLEGIALLGLPARKARSWIRVLVISLYCWSAVSKLDAAFLTDRGPWLLTGLLDGLGLETAMIPPQRLSRAAWLLPLGELVVAVALSLRGTRRVGMFLAIAMHAALLVALGPWGHDHHLGVLLWNAFFLVQTPLLFGRAPTGEIADETLPRTGASLAPQGAVKAVLAAAIVAPALEPWGWCDHWPAWAVYSDRPEIVRVWIPEAAARKLPAGLSCFPPLPLSDWCEVRFDEWSFSSRRCPVYPQARYRLALARVVADSLAHPETLRVSVESSPDRRTGTRHWAELEGGDELRRTCGEFWFNTRARP